MMLHWRGREREREVVREGGRVREQATEGGRASERGREVLGAEARQAL